MCDDFYLHLSSSEAAGDNPANFSINLPTPRTLEGSWKMALKEIHFTHGPTQYVESEPISFLVLGTAGNEDAILALKEEAMANKWAECTSPFPSNEKEPWSYFPHFPFAIILTYYKRPAEAGRRATYYMTPGGHYDSIEKYIRDLNSVLYTQYFYLQNLEGGCPYFTFPNEGKIKCRWSYFQNNSSRLFVLPILGKKSRELLGMGNMQDKDNMAFRRMIASIINKEDLVTLPYKHRLTHADDNILVLANIIEQTAGSRGENGKVLRVIENPGKQSTLVHLYFNDNNYMKVPLRNFHNVQIRLISANTHYDLTMFGTTTVVLHLVPYKNNCDELPTKSHVSIPIARHRSPSSISLVGSSERDPGAPILINEFTQPYASEEGKLPPQSHFQDTIATSIDLVEALGKSIEE
jgi:hypothetical protein